MNERYEGWRLVLMLLIPLAIIGGAVFIGISALSDDGNQNIEVADSDEDTAGQPTATALPVTEPVAIPTEDAMPTPIEVPTTEPTAEPTAGPDPSAEPTGTPTTAPAPTSAPSSPAPSNPAPSTPSGPTPTPTPDPDELTLTCVGEVPAELAVGETFGPLIAETSPPEAAATMSFVFDFGNQQIAQAAGTGLHSYPDKGTYTVTLSGVDSVTGTQLDTTCGTVMVGDPVEEITVSCESKPEDPTADPRLVEAPAAMRVTVSWSPRSAEMTLRYDLGPNEPIKIVDDSRSPAIRTYTWIDEEAEWSIFWSNAETGLSGTIRCPVYPDVPFLDPTPVPPAPTPTTPPAVPTPTPTP